MIMDDDMIMLEVLLVVVMMIMIMDDDTYRSTQISRTPFTTSQIKHFGVG